MAFSEVLSILFLVISVKSQLYTNNLYQGGYPYQNVYPTQNGLVNQPEGVAAWNPQVFQQPNQNIDPYYTYYPPQQPLNYQPYQYYAYQNNPVQPIQQSGQPTQQQFQPVQQQFQPVQQQFQPVQQESRPTQQKLTRLQQSQPNQQQLLRPQQSQPNQQQLTRPQQSQPNQQQEQQVKLDPYANVPTEIIDVDPVNFNRIMQQLKAEPIIVSYENRIRKGSRSRQPHFTVTAESKQSNKTSVPTTIQKHEVISKTYSFNKTYVLHPGDDKKSVINLNFVNGVQVTDAPEKLEEQETTTTVRTTTEITTTESDQPAAVNNWLF